MKLVKKLLATSLVFCLGISSMVNTAFAVEIQETAESIHYVRYDLEGGEKESYTTITTGETEKIEPSYGIMGPSPVPNVIFDDNWNKVTNTTTFPYRAIAYLEMSWNIDGEKYVHTGTGFAADDGKVLTAAHNLYNLSDDRIPHGEAPDSIKVVFGKNGSSSYRTAKATEFYINSEWESHEDANYDYGVIIVPTSVTDYTGHFGLDYEANTNTRYTLSGYPYSGNYNGKYLYTASGEADTVNSKTIYHYLNATGGVSGAPLYSSDCPNKNVEMPSADKIDQIERAIRHEERCEKLGKIQRVIVPIVTKAAVVFFVFFLGFSTVLITSADAREFVYQLVFTVHDRYSEVVIPDGDNSEDEGNPVYTLSYIPDGLELEEKVEAEGKTIYSYSNDNNNLLTISITNVDLENQNAFRFDTEDADFIEPINIGQSMGLKIVKQGRTQIVWQNERTYFVIVSDLESEDVVQIAKGIKEKE